MGTPFTELYGSVLSKIRNYDFIHLEEDEINEILSDYICESRFKSKRRG